MKTILEQNCSDCIRVIEVNKYIRGELIIERIEICRSRKMLGPVSLLVIHILSGPTQPSGLSFQGVLNGPAILKPIPVLVGQAAYNNSFSLKPMSIYTY